MDATRAAARTPPHLRDPMNLPTKPRLHSRSCHCRDSQPGPGIQSRTRFASRRADRAHPSHPQPAALSQKRTHTPPRPTCCPGTRTSKAPPKRSHPTNGSTAEDHGPPPHRRPTPPPTPTTGPEPPPSRPAPPASAAPPRCPTPSGPRGAQTPHARPPPSPPDAAQHSSARHPHRCREAAAPPLRSDPMFYIHRPRCDTASEQHRDSPVGNRRFPLVSRLRRPTRGADWVQCPTTGSPTA